MNEMAVLSTLAFIGFQGFFSLKALNKYRNQLEEHKSIFSQNTLAFLYGVVEPWKTKYCWAGFAQLTLIILLLIYL